MTQKFGQTLKRGDAVVISYNGKLYSAIFLEFGSKGNPRFILVNSNRIKWMKEAVNRGRVIRFDYVTRQNDHTLAKINVADCSQVVQDEFDEVYSLLKQNMLL